MLVGAKSGNLKPLKLANAALDAASWLTTLATGWYMFALEDNIRCAALVRDNAQWSGSSRPEIQTQLHGSLRHDIPGLIMHA